MGKYTKEDRLANLRVSNEETNRITKECIQTALLFFLNKKRLDDISIVELVNKAGVSRASFYNNYKSKADVLLDMSKDTMDLMCGTLFNDEEYAHDYYKWFKYLFDQIKLNYKWFKVIFRENIDLTTIFINNSGIRLSTMNPYITIAFKRSLLSIIKKWIDKDMVESTEEMAELCVKLYSNWGFNKNIE